jgi:hypothetical protein
MTNGESEEHKAPWATDTSGGAWPFQPDTPVGPLESMYQAGRAMLHRKYPLPMGLYAPRIHHFSSTEIRLSAPRELFRLTEAISELTERAVAEWSMRDG